MTSSSTPKVTLKLLIDTKNEKVLFAEAFKPAVDFLFNMLCLPIGTVVNLINKNNMVGSLGNLYQSVEDLNHNYMQQNQIKDLLLNPSPLICSTEISRLLPVYEQPSNSSSGVSASLLSTELDNEDEEEDEEEDENEDDEEEDETEESEEDDEDNLKRETLFYICPNECSYDVTCDKTTICSSCKRAMTCKTRYVGKKVVGFVKNYVTFLVMDDLLIQPMSTISCITLLKQFNIKDIDTLQEMVVELGVDEGIKLLKASLQSKMVLTSVFIKKEC